MNKTLKSYRVLNGNINVASPKKLPTARGKNRVKRNQCRSVDKSPKVYTQLAREGVVLTQDSDNI